MALYRLMLAGEAGVTVPEPVQDLTTRRLLTMTWLEGRPLLEVAQELSGAADQERRNAIALNMFRAWYVPFYYYGVIHGDPHLGNYSVRPDDGVNLLDFGCIRVFRPGFVEGVIDLYRAFETDDDELAIKAYESWGFAGIADKPDLMQALNIWARFLYKPLLEDRVQSIMGERGSMAGAEAAGRVHQELRRLGGVKPPREFVLMDRAAIGLGSVFLHLKAEINWHRMFHEMIAGFDAAALGRRQKQVLKQVGLPEEIP